jgi:hypothetical protein
VKRPAEARQPRRESDDGLGSDTDPRLASFLRGVTIGALVGAAIAGSALWERAQRRRMAAAADEAGDAPPPS